MFDWLFEGQVTVYAILAAVTATFLALWWRDRRRHWLLAGAAGAVFIVAYFALDHFVETPREEIERRLQEMSAAVKQANVEKIFEHLSPQFNRRGRNQQAFKQMAQAVLAARLVSELTVKNVRIRDEKEKKIAMFQAVPWDRQGNPRPFFVQAEFGRDPDGKWRMRNFEVYNLGSESPLSIPGLD